MQTEEDSHGEMGRPQRWEGHKEAPKEGVKGERKGRGALETV